MGYGIEGNPERSEGYYWVLPKNLFRKPEWEVRHWDGFYWWATGDSDSYDDLDLTAIGPKVQKPLYLWEGT